MGVNNNNFLNLQKSSFNTTNNESVEEITQELFKILNDSDSEILSTENKSRISSVFSNILGNKSLQNEESTLVPLLDRVCQDFKKEDIRKIFIACLRKCPDAMISSVLKLDAWKNSFTNNTDDLSLKTNAETARERIIKCFKNNEIELSLNELNLPLLPDIALTYLTHLKKLNVSKNALTFLPIEIGQLSQLQYLYCSGNQLTSLPTAIGQLSQLQELYCFFNQLTSLPTEIGQLSQLQYLYCSGNQLTSLPTAIGQLSQLQHLYCAGNQLTSLPTEIGQLSQLQELYCSGNQLTSLLTEIGQLSQLKTLYCPNNQLTSLPTEIGQLSQLQELYCPNNQLTSLPTEIGQLSQLKTLDCSNNQLTSLPTEIRQLSQLQDLYCSGNQLTSLPTEIGQLSQLQYLYCSGNQLTSLPTEIGQLSQLQDLNCASNQLTTLPIVIGQLSQLKRLFCFHNQLQSLPIEIGQLSQLKKLHCSNNQLTSLPTEIGQLSQLQELHCSNNQLTSLPTEIGQLSQLWLLVCSFNQLQTMPDQIGALNLESFDCQANFLTTLPDALVTRFSLGIQNGSYTQSSYTPNNNNTPVSSNGLDAFKQATQDPSLKKLDTSFLNSSDHPGLSANVLQWLNKLRTAQEFKNEKTRPLFATQVLSILQFAKNNPEYLETLKAQLVDVLSSCVDRAASPINYLEFQKMVLESKDGSIENFMKLLKSGLALEVLDNFAKEFMKQHTKADEIEVYLGLKMKLKDVLGLPTLGNMNFFGCSDLKDKDLVKAEALVRDAWDNMEMLTSFFLSQDVWIEKLKTAYRIELDKHLDPVNEKLEQLTGEADQLKSDDFKKKTDLLQAEHQRLEKEWLRTKTIELLKTASSTKGEGKQEIRSSMETLIGILRKSSTLTSADLIKAVASLDSPVLGKVYYHVYDMAKKNNMNTNHVDFGKVAFCKQEGFDVPDVLRLKAIQKGILDELANMLKKGKRNGVLALIFKLPVDIENRIYGEVYCIEKKNGQDVSHWDFGRAAFHQQDGKDVTDDIRIVALRNVSDGI